VCALAVAGRADLLITFDRGYLNEPLRAHGAHVIEPDEFLAAGFEEHPRCSSESSTSRPRAALVRASLR